MKNIKHIAILVLISLSLACGKKEKDSTVAAEPMQTQPTDDSHSVRLSRAQYAQARIETGTFSQRSLSDYLETDAELILGKENIAEVSAFTEGLIQELRVHNYSKVAKGTVIAVLHKPDLLDLQQQYLENKDQLLFLETEYQRYKVLKENDATANKNFQKAEAEWRAAQTRGKLLAAKLSQYQINPAKLDPDHLQTVLVIKTPIAGVVTQIEASVGAALSMGDPICEISNLESLHPVLYVFEKDLPKVKAGQKVQLSLPNGQGQVFTARIDYLERSVDATRKTVKVHARFDNSTLLNNPQMAQGAFFKARVALAEAGILSALPEAAVIQEATGHCIFYEKSRDASGVIFYKMPVKTGAYADGYVAVEMLETLPPGAKIVLKGAYYLSAQSTESSTE